MAIITGSDLRTYLGLSSQEDAGRLAQFADGAAAWVAGKTGRTWAQAVYTNELYRGTDTYDLVLNHYPVATVSAVTAEGLTLDITNQKVVELSDPQSGVLTRTDGCAWRRLGYRSIAVTYTGGPATIPADLILGTLELAAWAYQTTGGRLSVTGAEVSATFSGLAANGVRDLPMLEAALRRNGDILGAGL